MRGTFRLSMVGAVLAAGYGVYSQWADYSASQDTNRKLVTTLECGANVSQATLNATVNQFGNFDLGKVGCADRQFWASSDELAQARSGSIRRDWLQREFHFRHAAEQSAVYAIMALIGVNL